MYEDVVEKMRRSMGLTLYEARLYLAMLRGARNPRDASSMSGVPLPRIYDVVRALEAKGFVEPEPGGWYRPRPPSAVAAAMLAKVEEEARRRARTILELAESLEEMGGREPQGGLVLVRGRYSVISSIVEEARNAGEVYILIGPQLEDRRELIQSIARGVLAVAPKVVILARGVDEEFAGELREIGAVVERVEYAPFSIAASRRMAAFLVEDPQEGELVALIIRDPGQAMGVVEFLRRLARPG